MALSAYAGSGYLIFYSGYGMAIFAFIWTLIFICYIEVTTFWYPMAYNKYAHLVLECLAVLWWLVTFALLALIAAAWDWAYGLSATCYGGSCAKLKARAYDYNGPANATKAAAALGAFEWLLFCVSLVAYGIFLHRNRRADREARQVGIAGSAVVEEHKLNAVNPHPVYAAQPTYSQAPVDPRYQNVNMA